MAIDLRNKITVGADVEYPIVHRRAYVSVAGKLGCSKQNPHDIPGIGNLQEDNVLAEVAIEPCSTADQFIERLGVVRRKLVQHLAACDVQGSLSYHASPIYNRRELEHRNAREFGCEPDLCAYSLQSKEPPPCAANNRRRYTGGHIHVGFGHNDFYDKVNVIRWMDLLINRDLAVSPDRSVRLPCTNNERARRRAYGQIGSFRPKPYGVEYRAMSNQWTKTNKHIEEVFYRAKLAVRVARYADSADFIQPVGYAFRFSPHRLQFDPVRFARSTVPENIYDLVRLAARQRVAPAYKEMYGNV